MTIVDKVDARVFGDLVKPSNCAFPVPNLHVYQNKELSKNVQNLNVLILLNIWRVAIVPTQYHFRPQNSCCSSSCRNFAKLPSYSAFTGSNGRFLFTVIYLDPFDVGELCCFWGSVVLCTHRVTVQRVYLPTNFVIQCKPVQFGLHIYVIDFAVHQYSANTVALYSKCEHY